MNNNSGVAPLVVNCGRTALYNDHLWVSCYTLTPVQGIGNWLVLSINRDIFFDNNQYC